MIIHLRHCTNCGFDRHQELRRKFKSTKLVWVCSCGHRTEVIEQKKRRAA